MLAMRMSRHGAKKRPFYHIVVADSRSPRDGRFVEKIGTYNPMLAKEDQKRVILQTERVQHWLKVGAQPSERVARILHAAGLAPKVETAARPKKSAPKAKAQERIKAAAAAAEEAAAKAAEAAAAPAAE